LVSAILAYTYNYTTGFFQNANGGEKCFLTSIKGAQRSHKKFRSKSQKQFPAIRYESSKQHQSGSSGKASVKSGNTKGGSIIVLLTSCLTGLD
jgi:hypothetical protein